MKLRLSQKTVVNELSIDTIPTISDGRIVGRTPNAKRTSYIIFDTHPDSPKGFGVKVGASKKSYIIQRRVGEAIIKAKVQDVADGSIETARRRASDLAREMVEQRVNPNAVRREEDRRAGRWELGQILRDFRGYMEGRQDKPAKPTTLKQIDTAIKLLDSWQRRTLPTIRTDEITARFHHLIETYPQREAERRRQHAEMRALNRSPNYKPRKVPSRSTGTQKRNTGRTSVETSFKWTIAAVRRAIDKETFDAANERRKPAISTNPFLVLVKDKYFRSKARLEKDVEQNQGRNPLGLRDGTLREFLEALWPRFCERHMGAQYLLVTLLLGARRNETAALMWRERISAEEANHFSWVELDAESPRVLFRDTKNGTSHELPLVAGAAEIFRRRREDAGKREKYVWPARKNAITKHAVHYTDPKSVLTYIRQAAIENAEAKKKAGLPFGNPELIGRVRPHDLRRTFGRIADEYTSAAMSKRLLNHKRPGETTERYLSPEWMRVAEVIQQIEVGMLSAFPPAYNALLPAQGFPRLPE